MQSIVIGGSIYHGGVAATFCRLHQDFIKHDRIPLPWIYDIRSIWNAETVAGCVHHALFGRAAADGLAPQCAGCSAPSALQRFSHTNVPFHSSREARHGGKYSQIF